MTASLIECRGTENGSPQLVLGGRLTVAEAKRLQAAAIQLAESRGSSVDCTALEHLDGSIVQVLICLRQNLASINVKLSIDGLAEPYRTELALLAFDAAR